MYFYRKLSRDFCGDFYGKFRGNVNHLTETHEENFVHLSINSFVEILINPSVESCVRNSVAKKIAMINAEGININNSMAIFVEISAEL